MRYTIELTPGELAMLVAAIETQERFEARVGLTPSILLASAKAKVMPHWRRFKREQRAAERALAENVVAMAAD